MQIRARELFLHMVDGGCEGNVTSLHHDRIAAICPWKGTFLEGQVRNVLQPAVKTEQRANYILVSGAEHSPELIDHIASTGYT